MVVQTDIKTYKIFFSLLILSKKYMFEMLIIIIMMISSYEPITINSESITTTNECLMLTVRWHVWMYHLDQVV